MDAYANNALSMKWISLKEECGPHIEKDPMDKDKTKPKKPSAKSHNSPISKRELGDKDLGTRCYAKHTSGSWYWGTLGKSFCSICPYYLSSRFGKLTQHLL